MPLSNIIPFTQFLPSCGDFESLQPILTDYLGLSLKSRCERKLFGAKWINYPTISSFTKPVETITYTAVTGILPFISNEACWEL